MSVPITVLLCGFNVPIKGLNRHKAHAIVGWSTCYRPPPSTDKASMLAITVTGAYCYASRRFVSERCLWPLPAAVATHCTYLYRRSDGQNDAWFPSVRKDSVTRRNAPHLNSAGTPPALADSRKNTTRFSLRAASSCVTRLFSRRFCRTENDCGHNAV